MDFILSKICILRWHIHHPKYIFAVLWFRHLAKRKTQSNRCNEPPWCKCPDTRWHIRCQTKRPLPLSLDSNTFELFAMVHRCRLDNCPCVRLDHGRSIGSHRSHCGTVVNSVSHCNSIVFGYTRPAAPFSNRFSVIQLMCCSLKWKQWTNMHFKIHKQMPSIWNGLTVDLPPSGNNEIRLRMFISYKGLNANRLNELSDPKSIDQSDQCNVVFSRIKWIFWMWNYFLRLKHLQKKKN